MIASPRGGTTYLTMMMTMTRIMKIIRTRMMVMVMSRAGTTYVTAKETSQLKEVHIEAAIPYEMKLYVFVRLLATEYNFLAP